MSKTDIVQWLDRNSSVYADLAKQIWDRPEIGYTESFASSLQISALSADGFTIKRLTDLPTAFVAEYGSGKPVIGILGEFDALPGLSQAISPAKDPLVPNGPGHGCGHNLLGTAGVSAAAALRKQMDEENISGTIRYYGCPAEELLSGKCFMARAGVFDDLDAVLTWHPSTLNEAVNYSFLAATSVEFFFSGVASHAGAAPHLGRSALDAMELMNVGANYMREHVPDGSRLHYQITNGGAAPNIVPDAASVLYFVRATQRPQVDELFERLIKVAQGAAMMTETTVRWVVTSACYDSLANLTLNDAMLAQADVAGLPSFTNEEVEFSAALQATTKPKAVRANAAPAPILDMSLHNVKARVGTSNGGSSDVGDVSWIAPMGQVMTTCAPVGVQFHTWQATASFGSSVGQKGMHFAAKLMALTAYDLLLNVDGLLDRAKAEFKESTDGFGYTCALPATLRPPSPA